MRSDATSGPSCLTRRQWGLAMLGAVPGFAGGQQTGWKPTVLLEGGTIIVAACSRERIVIAADSKASFRTDGFQDEVCKLAVPANKVLFAASGLVGVGDWSAADEAKSAALRIVGDNPYLSGSSLGSLAEAWARAMAAKIRTLPPAIFGEPQAESQTSALFAGLDRADEVNLVRATVQPVAAAGGKMDARTNVIPVEIPTTGTRFLAFGMPAIAMEFLAGKTPRAKEETAQWKTYFAGSADIAEDIAIRLVELTSYFEPRKDLVGGATAAVRMDGKAGVRWLRRPPACLR
ncbi:MAG: hypothetical protein IT169_04065 [Bryobacterales bacterium]|nr:hypothetical protein [Bryobacterales bacterium]